jgi:hypothetical protein
VKDATGAVGEVDEGVVEPDESPHEDAARAANVIPRTSATREHRRAKRRA